MFASVFLVYFRSSLQKDAHGFPICKMAGKVKRGTIVIHTVLIVWRNFPKSLMYLGFGLPMLIHIIYSVTRCHCLSLLSVH